MHPDLHLILELKEHEEAVPGVGDDTSSVAASIADGFAQNMRGHFDGQYFQTGTKAYATFFNACKQHGFVPKIHKRTRQKIKSVREPDSLISRIGLFFAERRSNNQKESNRQRHRSRLKGLFLGGTIAKYSNQGYQVDVYGDHNHPPADNLRCFPHAQHGTTYQKLFDTRARAFQLRKI
ncbi:hypothetical protein DFS34DRAFT_590409 [Phlyctochytrium arcticum]|nr:hypothetical protein DFS34DRAFT_590409 [Phlyctochytrium arcticum]